MVDFTESLKYSKSRYILKIEIFRPPEKNTKTISCYSIENSPVQPSELLRIEKEKFLNLENENKIKVNYRFVEHNYILNLKNIYSFR